MIGISAMCAATSVNGIARSALPRTRSLRDDCRITATKTAVTRNSSHSPSQIERPSMMRFAVDPTASRSNAKSTASDPSTAPTSWATQ